jgi:hypothetical protein
MFLLVFFAISKNLSGIALFSISIPSLLGVYFIWIGWITLKGKAKDVLGNGISCLILGMLSIMSLKEDPAVHIVFAAIFIVSGVVVLIGRGDYRKLIAQT